jgi:hypothetical protein
VTPIQYPKKSRNATPAAYLILALSGGLAAGCSDQNDPPGEVNWSLAVVVATVGHSQDANGYEVRLDGAAAGQLTAEDTLFVYDLDPGQHVVELVDVARNCQAAPATPVSITLLPNENATAPFSVGCDSILTGVILFTRLIPASGSTPGEFGVYQIRPDGTALARVTQGSTATASPDGRQIVFHRFPSIYRVNVDGTRQWS